jgi:DNA-binding NtrC family response regulator
MAQESGYKILVVEDNEKERQGLRRLLVNSGYQVLMAESAEKALGYLDEPIDFVLTDLQMGEVSGVDLIRHWKPKQPDSMFLMITGHGSMASAIESIRAGAYHYLTKPIDPNSLLNMLQNMARQREETQRVSELRTRLDKSFGISNIIGKSAVMERVFELIRRSAQAFSTVLILGESGTGKELVAQAIHHNSPRREGPFVAVNCAAIPATLVESELFGHEKGAFTGAAARRSGRFELASGGTFFIDEIGDLELPLQIKLLRVLETRTVTPVGGNAEIKTDTRVLAATSRNIEDMMAKGTFREDLYYRLNVITIEIPPLRERLDDVPLLVKKLVERVNEQNGTNVSQLSPELIDALQHYHWPGNVRELMNVIERMIVLSDKNHLDLTDLPVQIRQSQANKVQVALNVPRILTSGSGDVPTSANPANPKIDSNDERLIDQFLGSMTMHQLEDRAINAALKKFKNNRTLAARALGISVRTLQRKLGLKNESVEGSTEDAELAGELTGTD